MDKKMQEKSKYILLYKTARKTIFNFQIKTLTNTLLDKIKKEVFKTILRDR